MKIIIQLVFTFSLIVIPVTSLRAEVSPNRLRGKILLQVEDKGQAWYIDQKTGEKNYMANGNEAFNIMRSLGVGITSKDLEKIKNNKNLALRQSGKIFLQVESKGEAYYVDFNGNLHYLKNGSGAYEVMRKLGLGITNKDLEKINISIKSKIPSISATRIDKDIKSDNQSDNASEEDFSDVIVKLYTAQLEVLQNTIDMNAKAKNIFAGIKQTWNDELIKTEVQIIAYPSNTNLNQYVKVYRALMSLVDIQTEELSDKDKLASEVKLIVLNDINYYKSVKVSRSDVSAIFNAINKVGVFNNQLSTQLSALYQTYFSRHHDAAVYIDAINGIKVAKQQQEINKTNALIAETKRVVAQAEASMQQSQNMLNWTKPSLPTYCSATSAGIGMVNVVCHQ